MIVLQDVTKTTRVGSRSRHVLSAVNVEIPTDRRIALLGKHEGHKRVLIHLLSGVEKPTAGRIARFAEISFPVGFLPGLVKDLSVRANVAHVARLYSADVRRTSNLVEMILDIGPRFDRPYGELDIIGRRYLAEIVPLCLPFDTYLLADDKLVRRWQAQKPDKQKPNLETRIAILFNARFRNAGMIIPTADIDFAREHCDMSLVMDGDGLVLAEGVHPALESEGQLRSQKRRGRAANLKAGVRT